MKRMRHLQKIFLYLLSFLIIAALFQIPAFAEEEIEQATAAAMRMRKTEGTVRIADKKGKSVSVFKDMRLYDGYNIETLKNGYAWIDLDSTKLIKLDAESRTAVQKSGKEMDIILKKGKLFFNVAKPLEEDESFYIRTSTTMVGIRGTCGWVEVVNKNETRVYILEGSVQVAVIDPVTREIKVDSVSGGDTVACVVYDQTKPDDKCDIIRNRFSEKDVPGFVVVELVNDMKHVDEIFEKSKTDVDLRRLTQSEAKKRLQADQKETVEMRQENNEDYSAGPPVIKQCIVSFDSMGGSPLADAQNIAAGNKAQKPDDPEKGAYTFDGWYTDSGYTAKWDFNSEVQDNMTLFARWIDVSGDIENSALKWSLDDTGTLIISGDGAMPDFPTDLSAPWYTKRDSIEKAVVIESGVTSIGSYAFRSCSKFTSVTIPASVASIGSYAFDRCNYLTSVSIPASVTSIDESAFSSCTSLTSVTIPKSVTSISKHAFNYCINLTSVSIPASVTSIGAYAFPFCYKLTSVTIPKSVTSIGANAFEKCGLTSVTIPEGVASIGAGAFVNCSNLTSVTIPKSVTSIEWQAFAYCTGLTSVAIPNNDVSYSSAFDYCTNLKDVYFDGTSADWDAKPQAWKSPFNGKTIHYKASAARSAVILNEDEDDAEEQDNNETLLEMEEMSEEKIAELKKPSEETNAESTTDVAVKEETNAESTTKETNVSETPPKSESEKNNASETADANTVKISESETPESSAMDKKE